MTSMSPEQLRGEALDGRSDLFSLGSLFYQMLTGQHAFTGASGEEVDAAMLGQPAPDPRRIRPDIPAALALVVLRCLEKDRDARPQTAAELVNDLRRVRNPAPVVTAAAPAPAKEARGGSGKWLGIAAGVVVIALGGYAVTQLAPALSSSAPQPPKPASTTNAAATPPIESLAEALAHHRPYDTLAGEAATPLAVAKKEMEAARLRGAAPPLPTIPAPRVLVPPGFDLFPLLSSERVLFGAIAPDGKRFVFRRADSSDIWEQTPPGGQDVRVLAATADREVVGMTVTPDSAAVDLIVRAVPARAGAASAQSCCACRSRRARP